MIYTRLQFNDCTLYINIKETTRLAEMSTIERLEVSDSKVVSISNNNNKPFYY